jgi:hypothetical protein
MAAFVNLNQVLSGKLEEPKVGHELVMQGSQPPASGSHWLPAVTV